MSGSSAQTQPDPISAVSKPKRVTPEGYIGSNYDGWWGFL
jgi:hypothetical protein